MKNLFYTLTLVFLVLSGYSQNKSLIIAPNYVPDISAYSLDPLPTNGPINTNYWEGYKGQPASSGQNIITDEVGEIIFFIVDQFIYGRNGKFIDAISNIDGWDVTGMVSEIAVVPVPEDCNSWYLISTTNQFSFNNEFAKGFYGKLTVYYDDFDEILPISGLQLFSDDGCDKSKAISSLIGSTYYTDSDGHDERPLFAISPANTLDQQFLFVANGHSIFRMGIGSTGIYYDNYFVDANALFPSTSFSNLNLERQEMELIQLPNGNLRLAIPFTGKQTPNTTDNWGKNILVFDMDPTGYLIQGSQKICDYPYPSSSNIFIKGLELSPNGDYLYVTHSAYGNIQSTFDVFDVSLSIPTKTELSAFDGFKYGQIEHVGNGSLLISNPNGLVEFSNSNAPSSSNLNFGYISMSYPPSYPFSDSPTIQNTVCLLQDQIDGFDYDMDTKIYHADFYEVQSSATWIPNPSTPGSGNPLIEGNGNEAFIKNELRIKAGVTLTISNMLLHFAPGARVVIENGIGGLQGGKLILDNSALSNELRCEDEEQFWLGVEVWGNNNQTQGTISNSSQGRLIMQNSSIENAKIGVLLSKRTTQEEELPLAPGYCYYGLGEYQTIEVVNENDFVNQQNGGIIQTTDSWIMNCPTSVKFLPYAYNNISKFRRGGFRWNEVLLEHYLPNAHVEMTQVKPVSFYGCQFNNDVYDQYLVNDQGYGIKSYTSQFYIGRDCPSPGMGGQLCPGTQSYFRNLYMGIYSTSYNLTTTFTCDGNEFLNNTYGVYVQNNQHEQITRNIFKVREFNNYMTAGVALYNSTGFKIEENEFFEYDDLTVTDGTALSYGIVVNNSGTKYNEIYNNKFHNLKIGGQSEKVNGVQKANSNNTGPNGIDLNGLKWLCNDFVSNIVEADMTVISGRINFHQGGLSNYSTYMNAKLAAARNRFSLTGEPVADQHDVKLMNNSQEINYYWIAAPRHEPDSYTTSGGLAYTQVVNPDEIEFNNKSILEDQNACPTQLVTKPKSVLKSELLVIEQDLENIDRLYKEENYNNYLDLIETSTNPSELSDALLNAAPYLTDAVLIAYIQSGAPAGHIKAVLMAHSPLSESVLQALSESNLPQGTLNQIATVQQGINPRLLLLYTRHYLVGEYDKITDEIIRQYLTDNDFNGDYEGLKLFLNERPNDIKRKEVLLETHITKGEYAEAEMVKSELIQLNEDPEYIEIAEIEKNIHPSPSTGEEINNDPQLKAQIENIAGSQNSIHASGKAKGLLKMADGVGYIPNFLIGNSSMSLLPTEGAESSEKPELFKELTVSMYPNPSNGMVYFDLPEQEEGEMAIQLFDLSGKMVHAITFSNTNGELVDFSSVNKGTYIVKISLSNGFSEAQLLQLK